MIFDNNKLKENLKGLIGFRSPDNPSIDIDGLLESRSGYYVQDVHPLLTIDNIEAHAPAFERYQYTDASNPIVMNQGKIVVIGGQYYSLDRDYVNEVPNVNDLTKVNLFENWLSSILISSTIDVITEWSIKMSNLRQTKTILADIDDALTEEGNYTPIIPQGRYLVAQVFPSNNIGESVQVKTIRLCFSETQNVNINILRSDGSTRVIEGNFQSMRPKTIVIDEVIRETTLIYIDTQAITGSVMDLYPNRSQNIKNHVKKYWTTDLGDVKLTSLSMFSGMAIRYVRFCDLTDFVIENEMAFAKAAYYNAGIKLLRYMAMNPSTETTRSHLNIDPRAIIYEIDGDARGYREVGIGKAYDEALKSLSIDTSGISKPCLKCGKGSKVSYGCVFR